MTDAHRRAFYRALRKLLLRYDRKKIDPHPLQARLMGLDR